MEGVELLDNKQTAVKCKEAQDLGLTCDVNAFMGKNKSNAYLSMATITNNLTYLMMAECLIVVAVDCHQDWRMRSC